jgi:hypothetical protein
LVLGAQRQRCREPTLRALRGLASRIGNMAAAGSLPDDRGSWPLIRSGVVEEADRFLSALGYRGAFRPTLGSALRRSRPTASVTRSGASIATHARLQINDASISVSRDQLQRSPQSGLHHGATLSRRVRPNWYCPKVSWSPYRAKYGPDFFGSSNDPAEFGQAALAQCSPVTPVVTLAIFASTGNGLAQILN